ncbi:hypothetical protein [Saccharothrix stipae]
MLGIKVAASTVGQILKDAGIDPAAQRTSTTWSNFLRSQTATLLACDFFETVTLGGLLGRPGREEPRYGPRRRAQFRRPLRALSQPPPIKQRAPNSTSADGSDSVASSASTTTPPDLCGSLFRQAQRRRRDERRPDGVDDEWFGLLTDKLIRRSVHTSVIALKNDVTAKVPSRQKMRRTGSEITGTASRNLGRVIGPASDGRVSGEAGLGAGSCPQPSETSCRPQLPGGIPNEHHVT